MASPYDWCEQALATIHRANWYRSVKPLSGLPGPVVLWEGCPLINFASNDYLGLAGDSRLAQAAKMAIDQYGTGSTGSRLLSGHRPLHQALEAAIATWKQTESALVFSSGYLTNLGTIAALVGPRDLVLADEYNHSSLKHGAKLSQATVIDYRHVDMADLQSHLAEHRHQHRRCLIVTDSVFSMDGDLCPLPDLLDLATQYEAMVIIDEAHGTGVMGATGAGCVEHFGCRGAQLIQMGTLSKALGSLGGYVAAPAPVIDFLRNRAATWIYTTAPSPADMGAALAAIATLRSDPQRLHNLWARVKQLQALLKHLNCIGATCVLPSSTPIQCIQLPDPATALQVSAELMQQGIWVPAIRPPTVPTSRLRISVMATHTELQIEILVTKLRELL